jgi:hypothetical protein
MKKRIFIFFGVIIIASCHSDRPFTFSNKNDASLKKGNLLNQLFKDEDYLATSLYL